MSTRTPSCRTSRRGHRGGLSTGGVSRPGDLGGPATDSVIDGSHDSAAGTGICGPGGAVGEIARMSPNVLRRTVMPADRRARIRSVPLGTGMGLR